MIQPMLLLFQEPFGDVLILRMLEGLTVQLEQTADATKLTV